MLADISGLAAAERRTYEIVDKRVVRSQRAIRKGFTSAIKIKSRLWILNDYALLLIDDERGISDANRRAKHTNHLFPRLISTRNEKSKFHIKMGIRKTSIGRLNLYLGDNYLISLEQDAGVIIFQVKISDGLVPYQIDGSLLVLKFGSYYFKENCDEAFDEMIAFQAESLSKNDTRGIRGI